MQSIKNYRSEAKLSKITDSNVRSTSENRIQKKQNYHYTQQRSEEKKERIRMQPKNQFNIRQKNSSEKSLNLKLPDLKLYTSKPKTGIMQQQSSQLKSRLNMYDNPPSRASKMPQIQKNDKISLNYSSLSKAGFDGTDIKENQDRDLIYVHSKYEGTFGVMDGHGQDGDKVSSFIQESVLYMMKNQFEDFDFKWSFPQLHDLLRQHPNIGSQFSGTTITLVQIIKGQIIVGWLGDSRAILCRRNKNKRPMMIEAVDLSFDHKPNLQQERERIEAAGGFVDSYHGMNGVQLGPYRVWVKGCQYPGLAMSRSLGDQIAASVGVSQIPDVKSYDIFGDELFLIVASDGVWEFLSSQQVAEIVYPYYLKNDPQQACQKLYQESNQKWKQLQDGIDDITSVIVFFNNN